MNSDIYDYAQHTAVTAPNWCSVDNPQWPEHDAARAGSLTLTLAYLFDYDDLM